MNIWCQPEMTQSGERCVKTFDEYDCIVAKIAKIHEPSFSSRLYLAAPLP
jgi:hypothetical protein